MFLSFFYVIKRKWHNKKLAMNKTNKKNDNARRHLFPLQFAILSLSFNASVPLCTKWKKYIVFFTIPFCGWCEIGTHLGRTHKGATQTCRTPVSRGEELNIFNLNWSGILITCRWGTQLAVSLQNAPNKVYALLIIYPKLAVPLRWPSGSPVISSIIVSQ